MREMASRRRAAHLSYGSVVPYRLPRAHDLVPCPLAYIHRRHTRCAYLLLFSSSRRSYCSCALQHGEGHLCFKAALLQAPVKLPLPPTHMFVHIFMASSMHNMCMLLLSRHAYLTNMQAAYQVRKGRRGRRPVPASSQLTGGRRKGVASWQQAATGAAVRLKYGGGAIAY